MPNVDEPGAIPMFVAENRVFIDQNNHTFVVVHKTASGGSAQNIAQFFATDPAMASTHYIVGQDGTIVQCVQEKDGAGGNCCEKGNFASFLPVGQNLNTWTVSIEHVDPASDNSTPLTPAQKAASFKLIQHICQRHNIPMRRATNDGQGGIIGHSDIDPIDRSLCPNNYPWSELWDYLKGNSTDMIDITNPWVAGYFKQVASNRWHCTKTGFDLFAGILAGWQAMNGAPRLPVGPETPCGKQAVYQECESGVLVYDPAHELDAPSGPWAPCYLMKWDSALAKKLLAQPVEPSPSTSVDTTALIAAINAIPDAIAQPVANALIEAKKL